MQRRTLTRITVGTIGLLALGVALTSTVPTGALDGVVAAAGNDYLVVAGVAAVGLVAAFGRFYAGRASNIEQATMPDPERPVTVRPLGDEFDETLSNPRLHVPLVGRTVRRQLHTDLRDVAVRTLCRVGHCSRAEALAHLERGDWTTDDDAAAFLREDDPPTPSLTTELASLLRGDPWFRQQACCTAEALLTFAETSADENGRRSEHAELTERVSAPSGGDR
ncbi:hypothetical protein SAMN04487948_14015 [Halogranum amylolyticum]|uniref:Uncharacterized protein n=1 Tax=Halogranum amylolyticum TaxID=660520 RepID=A0A1H8WSN9_9EURY|nr:hypothetical protein [Halogranum amylolyticum]SEP30629.1 hypothetical protein SAMN04487948_14015 [Halogranum amylolyticum]